MIANSVMNIFVQHVVNQAFGVDRLELQPILTLEFMFLATPSSFA